MQVKGTHNAAVHIWDIGAFIVNKKNDACQEDEIGMNSIHECVSTWTQCNETFCSDKCQGKR